MDNVREHCLAASVLRDQDLNIHFLTVISEVLTCDRHSILANEQLVKSKHAHVAFLFARPVWLTNSARLYALGAPTAKWTMSTRTVIFNRGSCRLSMVGGDFVGNTSSGHRHRLLRVHHQPCSRPARGAVRCRRDLLSPRHPLQHPARRPRRRPHHVELLVGVVRSDGG